MLRKDTLDRTITVSLMLAALLIIFAISRVEKWQAAAWCVVLFLLLDVEHDRRNEISWRRFLPWGVVALSLPYLIYREAPTLWWSIAKWQFTNVQHLLDLNGLMKAIPFNDAAFIWKTRIPFFGAWIGWSYGWGFALVMWGAAIRSFFCRDLRKMVQYVLATHILQTPLILPFFWLINVQEVWYVLGHPDMLGRTWATEAARAAEAMNCFPSMHTSVAFAVLLLALREKGRFFKWGMVTFAASVIYSTMYMEIHWIVDVIAGMLFAWGVVRLSDGLLARYWRETPATLPVPPPAAKLG